MDKLELTPETIKEVISIKSKTRGADIKTMADYVRKKAGPEKLEEIEKLLEHIGHPMPYKELQKIKIYTLGERILYLLAIKRVLGWDDNQLKEMGYYVGKSLIIIKFFSHLFKINNNFFFKVLPKIGGRYMEGLKIIPVKWSTKDKIAIFQITGLEIGREEFLQKVEKVGLAYFEGFFAGWAQMILGGEKIQCHAQRKQRAYYFTISW